MWMLNRHGIEIAGTVEDTLVNASLINELQGKYDLSTCCNVLGVPEKYGDIYTDIVQYMSNKHRIEIKLDGLSDRKKADRTMPYFWWLPGDGIATTYASQDGISTWQLREAQLEIINDQNLEKVYGVERRVTKTLFRMERRGVPVNEEKLALVEKDILKKLKESGRKFKDGFNSRSPKDVREHVESLGHTDWPMTNPSKTFPNGQPSFKEEWLETFDAGNDILVDRRLNNLISTFVEGSIKHNIINMLIYFNRGDFIFTHF